MDPCECIHSSLKFPDESGQKKYVYVEDKWLVDSGLDEGSVWPEDIDE